MDARLGEHREVLTKALARWAPWRAMRSRFGVSRNDGASFMKLMK